MTGLSILALLAGLALGALVERHRGHGRAAGYRPKARALPKSPPPGPSPIPRKPPYAATSEADWEARLNAMGPPPPPPAPRPVPGM